MTIEIFIPYYGKFEYFSEAVVSVLSQTDHDWKLVIVDDAYPGNQAENFIKSFSDSRIAYVRNPVRLGVTRNFNRCVELAASDHMTILGSDDRLAINFISVAKKLFALHPDAEIYQVGVQVINEAGEPRLTLPDLIKRLIRPKSSGAILEGQSALESVLLGNWLYFPSLVWKSSSLKRVRFDTNLSIAQDLKVILKILLSHGKLAFSSEVAFQYRRHPASLSSQAAGCGLRYQEESKVLREIRPQLRELGWAKAEARARFRIVHRLAAAEQLLKSAIRGDRTGIKNLLGVILG